MSGKNIIGEERTIGNKYAQQLRSSFKKQVSVLDKITGQTSKPGYRVRFRDSVLQSIAVRTVKSPFVNFYGVDKERKSHSFKSRSGKTVIRKAHPFKLNPKILELSIPDNIINGLADDISNLRGDRVLVEAGNQLQTK